MQRRQFLQNSVMAAVSNTMETDRISQWETQRACLNYDPDMWSVDQDRATHFKAIEICNTECPVKAKCLEDFKKHRSDRKLAGVYAGKLWDGSKRAGQNVHDWHSTHRKGGEPKDTREGRKYSKGWIETRICECGAAFDVTPKNHTKRFCSETCLSRRAYKRAKEKLRGK